MNVVLYPSAQIAFICPTRARRVIHPPAEDDLHDGSNATPGSLSYRSGFAFRLTNSAPGIVDVALINMAFSNNSIRHFSLLGWILMLQLLSRKQLSGRTIGMDRAPTTKTTWELQPRHEISYNRTHSLEVSESRRSNSFFTPRDPLP
jgi:hypothetical protein